MLDLSVIAIVTLKTSLLIVAAGLLSLLVTTGSAAWRHFLWTSTLALSLLMPVAIAYLPSTVQLTLPWKSAEIWTRLQAAPVAVHARADGAEPAAYASRDKGPAVNRNDRPAPWPTAMIIWLIGALGVMSRIVLAHIGLFRWSRAARGNLSPSWAATVREVTRGGGLRRRLQVLETDRTDTACTWGFLRPVILLPAAGASWPARQRRFALLHELAHVRRFDYLTTQFANFACAVHWLNPLVWFAAAQARKLQEQACDDAVVNAGGAASDYAGFLVEVARAASQQPSSACSAAVGMIRRSQLQARVTAILDASRARLPMTGVALIAAVVPLACFMLLLATVSAGAAPTAQPEIPLTAPFRGVELRNGGRVTLIHGDAQRVTLLRGDAEQALIAVDDKDRLVIDHCKEEDCKRGHGYFEVEVTTPSLAEIAVREGGILQTRDGFPQQAEVMLAVSNGGMVDVRTLPVSNVTASVYSGGRIFSKPDASLTATVEQGGNVTYWGNPFVRESIRFGGVVQQGAAADFTRSLAELDPALEPPPPVPPVAAVPPIQPIGG